MSLETAPTQRTLTSEERKEPLVVFENVDKSYDGNNLVVQNLDLIINRGEFLTLLGPSGSGKTTILMMLAGFENPTAGSITLGHAPLIDVPTYKRHFGMVFQNYALFPHMTVQENLAFPLRMHGFPKSKIPQLVKNALHIVKLPQLSDRRPGQLSGGQQQRVALARALVFDPTLVLMDEPLGALDKQLREHMQVEIKHIHEQLGITMLYVTHDQSEALTMSDRVAVLNEGRIQQIDTPGRIYDLPQKAFVASFIGENNALRGEVAGVEGDATVIRLDAGGSILTTSNQQLLKGAKVVVSIRPERISFNRKSDPLSRRSELPALVEEVIYHGDYKKLRISMEGIGCISAKILQSDDEPSVVVGQQGMASWAVHSALALPIE